MRASIARIAFFTRISLHPLIPSYYYRATVYIPNFALRIGAANKSLFHTERFQRDLPILKEGCNQRKHYLPIRGDVDLIPSHSSLAPVSHALSYLVLPRIQPNNLPTSFPISRHRRRRFLRRWGPQIDRRKRRSDFAVAARAFKRPPGDARHS